MAVRTEMPSFLADVMPKSIDAGTIDAYVELSVGLNGPSGETVLLLRQGRVEVVIRTSVMEKFDRVTLEGPPRLRKGGTQPILIVRTKRSEHGLRLSVLEANDIEELLGRVGLVATEATEQAEPEQRERDEPALVRKDRWREDAFERPTELEPDAPARPSKPEPEPPEQADEGKAPARGKRPALIAGAIVLAVVGVMTLLGESSSNTSGTRGAPPVTTPALPNDDHNHPPSKRPERGPWPALPAPTALADWTSAEDGDGDGVPDYEDVAPKDANVPKVVSPGTILAHSPTDLYRLDPGTQKIEHLRRLASDRGAKVTDIAIDPHGLLYVISFDRIFTCDPDGPSCWARGRLPVDGNALTVITREPFLHTTLFLQSTTRQLWVIRPAPLGWGAPLGPRGARLAPNARSGELILATNRSRDSGPFGDIVDDPDLGLFATTFMVINAVDRESGSFEQRIDLTCTSAFGLAAYDLDLFAFCEDGQVFLVDPLAWRVKWSIKSDIRWWGAASRPKAPEPHDP